MIYQQLVQNHGSAITRVKARSNCGSPASPQLLNAPLVCQFHALRMIVGRLEMNRIEPEMPSSDGEIRD
jgi:hypothetical protein